MGPFVFLLISFWLIGLPSLDPFWQLLDETMTKAQYRVCDLRWAWENLENSVCAVAGQAPPFLRVHHRAAELRSIYLAGEMLSATDMIDYKMTSTEKCRWGKKSADIAQSRFEFGQSKVSA